ncbi:hypothetical protein ABIE09_003418 [Lysobacter enzymogenes]|uniref:hypothetical protein n=1 Tax=Lysobacter enzymogenes TaxID=69 RepID=UPI00339A8D20
MSAQVAQFPERLRRFVRKLKKIDDISSLIEIWNASGEAYLFGGAPRDVAFGLARRIHDLDIFVSGPLQTDLLMHHVDAIRRTKFGGYRFSVGRFDVDVWELDKSYAFRFGNSSHISVNRLLESVCFSSDGIAVSLKSGRSLYTKNFVDTLEYRRLDFIVPPESVEPVVGARIARLALKLDLALTPAVASYFVKCVEDFGVIELINAEARWGEHRMLNELSMEQVKSEIREAIDQAFDKLRFGNN